MGQTDRPYDTLQQLIGYNNVKRSLLPLENLLSGLLYKAMVLGMYYNQVVLVLKMNLLRIHLFLRKEGYGYGWFGHNIAPYDTPPMPSQYPQNLSSSTDVECISHQIKILAKSQEKVVHTVSESLSVINVIHTWLEKNRDENIYIYYTTLSNQV